MATSDRNDDQTGRQRQNAVRSEPRDAASSAARPDRPERQEGRPDELSQAADYQIQPEDQRPEEADRDRTGTARRAEEAAGQSPDENNREDAERAFRRSRGNP